MMRLLAALVCSLMLAPDAAAGELLLDLRPHGSMATAAGGPRLRIGATAAAVIATGALTLWGASAIENATDDVTGCRWCDPGGVDRWARQLRWRDTRAASGASDLLLLGVPVTSAATIAWLAASEGGPREIIEDVLVIAAAMAVTDPLTTGVKHGTGRLRPHAWAAGGPRVPGDLHSFFSGHTSRVFAAAAAAAQVARLRGRSGWRWVAAAAFTAAAATGWLRVASDQHWATDVLAGAAVGTAMGLSVATVALRPAESRPPAAWIAFGPAGLAIVF